METISKYKWPLMVVLVMSFCALLFFSLYFCDVKALTDFSRAYTKYDRAISDWSASFAGSAPEGAPGTDALERKVESAFFELKADASERISSLIKHDEEFMRIEQEIAELS